MQNQGFMWLLENKFLGVMWQRGKGLRNRHDVLTNRLMMP